jgi:D-aminopeptidase
MAVMEKRKRARDIGIDVGVLPTGPLNAITDVAGVKVGHTTLNKKDHIRTGVTAIVPHGGNIFREKVPAAISIANGFGKMAGYTQVDEVGTVETPILLTNTLSVGTAFTAAVRYTMDYPGNEDAVSINAVVGEINDGYLNDIRGLHVTEKDALAAIASAASGAVKEGCVGAGTGAKVFRYKSGIGTASRIVRIGPRRSYMLGVLVLPNYAGLLDINGAPIGRELGQPDLSRDDKKEAGSCIVVVATDAPLSAMDLKRLGRRSFHGLARTGSFMTHGSGDYAVAFSTAYRVPHDFARHPVAVPATLVSAAMTPFFQAIIEATQEAVYNALFMAETTTGKNGRIVPALDIADTIEVCTRYNVLNLSRRLVRHKA